MYSALTLNQNNKIQNLAPPNILNVQHSIESLISNECLLPLSIYYYWGKR